MSKFSRPTKCLQFCSNQLEEGSIALPKSSHPKFINFVVPSMSMKVIGKTMNEFVSSSFFFISSKKIRREQMWCRNNGKKPFKNFTSNSPFSRLKDTKFKTDIEFSIQLRFKFLFISLFPFYQKMMIK